MASDLILYVIHISGRRMIECGMDGLSRGMTDEGVMKGAPMIYFLMMYRSAIEHSDGLLSWTKT